MLNSVRLQTLRGKYNFKTAFSFLCARRNNMLLSVLLSSTVKLLVICCSCYVHIGLSPCICVCIALKNSVLCSVGSHWAVLILRRILPPNIK